LVVKELPPEHVILRSNGCHFGDETGNPDFLLIIEFDF
jgi:hypothetical protein